MNQDLLYKYFKGTTTIEEEKRILDWVEASEENREAFLKERMMFDVALFSDRQNAGKKIFRLAKNAFAGEYDDETILKWLKTFYRRFFMQQFKRSCLPDGPKVGSVAVSPRGDLRMPSDASAALWMKELEQIRI